MDQKDINELSSILNKKEDLDKALDEKLEGIIKQIPSGIRFITPKPIDGEYPSVRVWQYEDESVISELCGIIDDKDEGLCFLEYHAEKPSPGHPLTFDFVEGLFRCASIYWFLPKYRAKALVFLLSEYLKSKED